MEAKWCPQHGYPLPCAKCGLGLYEAGTQAGIKEVVEFVIKKNRAGGLYFHDGHWLKTFEFQLTEDELKEWGIEGRSN